MAEFPSEIRVRIDELFENADIKSTAKAAEKISRDYREENSLGKRSAAAKEEILAYCAVRMPATFAAASRALELSLECCNEKITSILDVGAGTGSASIAAALLTGCTDIRCIEREENMISIGKEFFHLMGIQANWIQRDISEGFNEKADLAVCSYCLNELPDNKRYDVLDKLIRAAGKMLVIIEPGTPKSFEWIKSAREMLIKSGLKIAAPCPVTSNCSLTGNDWCHFTARAARSRLHKQLKNADSPFEDEKFCFITAVRENALPCYSRVLRHPLIEPGRITLKLCTKNGLETRTVTKKNSGFKAARKSKTGDIFSDDRH